MWQACPHWAHVEVSVTPTSTSCPCPFTPSPTQSGKLSLRGVQAYEREVRLAGACLGKSMEQLAGCIDSSVEYRRWAGLQPGGGAGAGACRGLCLSCAM